MATYFVVGDVHGFFDKLTEALNTAGFDINNPNHVFISLGDLLDRGPQANECLEFVNSIPDNRKVLIRGNHEDLMEEAIQRGCFLQHDYHNRTNDTVEQLIGITYPLIEESELLKRMLQHAEWIKYINSCIDYFETDKYIFVHSFIPFISDNDSPDYWRNGDWKEARWGNPFENCQKGLNKTGKTIVCGHWHTSWAHSKIHHQGTEFNTDYGILGGYNTANFGIFKDEGIIGIDACTAVSGQVNVLRLGKQHKLTNRPMYGQMSFDDLMGDKNNE